VTTKEEVSPLKTALTLKVGGVTGIDPTEVRTSYERVSTQKVTVSQKQVLLCYVFKRFPVLKIKYNFLQ